MPQMRDRALVLRLVPFSESTLIGRFYGEEHGKFSAMARGVKGLKSRLGGALEPFMLIEARVSAKEGAELGTVSGFDVLREWPRLRTDLAAHALAAVVWEAMDRGTEDGKPHPEIFALGVGYLEALELAGAAGRADAESLTAHALLRLLGVLGFAPDLSEVGQPSVMRESASAPGDEYDWRYFLLDEGRLATAPPVEGRRAFVRVDALTRGFLRISAALREAEFGLKENAAPESRRKAALNLLFRLLAYYLETDLRSVRFLRRMVWGE